MSRPVSYFNSRKLRRGKHSPPQARKVHLQPLELRKHKYAATVESHNGHDHLRNGSTDKRVDISGDTRTHAGTRHGHHNDTLRTQSAWVRDFVLDLVENPHAADNPNRKINIALPQRRATAKGPS